MNYKLNDGSIVDLTALDKHQTDILLLDLQYRSLEHISELVTFTRFNYSLCKNILTVGLAKSTPGLVSSAVKKYSTEHFNIMLLGLLIFHNKDYSDIINKLKEIDDTRLIFLNGTILMKEKKYNEAIEVFEEIKYKKGIELCKMIINQGYNTTGTDSFILINKRKINFNLIKLNEINNNIRFYSLNKDYLFRINKSEEYTNENNLDVRIAKVNEILEGSDQNHLNLINEIKSLLEITNSLEVKYMLGKAYHLAGDISNATNIYTDIILKNDYPPAFYNLCRIMGIPYENKTSNILINDYNTVYYMKEGISPVMMNISDELKNLILPTITLKDACIKETSSSWLECNEKGNSKFTVDDLFTLDFINTLRGSIKSLFLSLLPIKDVFDQVVLYNNIAVLFFNYGCRDLATTIIKQIKKDSNSSMLPFLEYNLALFENNVSNLLISNLNQAKILTEFIQSDLKCSDLDVQAYILYSKKQINNLITHGSILGPILCGCIKLQEGSYDEAIDYFKQNPKSWYSVNGLGVCSFMKKEYKEAISYFKQVVDFYPVAYLNLGNVYFKMNDYEKALVAYLKYLDLVNIFMNEREVNTKCNNLENILLKIAHDCKDINQLKKLEEYGMISKSNKEKARILAALLMIDNGGIDQVREMNLDSLEVKEKIELFNKKEEERKRKIKEIEEFRKSRRKDL